MPQDDTYEKEKLNQSTAEYPSPTSGPSGALNTFQDVKDSLDEESWQGRGCRGTIPGGGNTLIGGVKR